MIKKLSQNILILVLVFAIPAFAERKKPSHPKPPKISSGKMTLADSVFLALRHNRTIQSAHLARVSQKYNLAVAEDEFYPDLFINPSLQRSSSGATASVDERLDTHTYGADVRIQQKLKTGGSFSFAWNNNATQSEATDQGTLTTSWAFSVIQPLLRGGQGSRSPQQTRMLPAYKRRSTGSLSGPPP